MSQEKVHYAFQKGKRKIVFFIFKKKTQLNHPPHNIHGNTYQSK